MPSWRTSAAFSSASASAFCGLWMSTSGSMIGTSPAARIWRATSNCWSTTASTPAGSASLMTERILVPNTPLATARASSVVEAGHRLHHLGAVDLVGQALVDLQERHHALDRPQVVGRLPALDLAVHGGLEEDRAEDALAGEAGLVMIRLRISWMRSNISVVVRVGVLAHAVELQGLRGAAPALVEGGDEALARP